MSSPTAKQLASWLKEADKAVGLLDVSITGLVFMVVADSAKLALQYLDRRLSQISSSSAHIGDVLCQN